MKTGTGIVAWTMDGVEGRARLTLTTPAHRFIATLYGDDARRAHERLTQEPATPNVAMAIQRGEYDDAVRERSRDIMIMEMDADLQQKQQQHAGSAETRSCFCPAYRMVDGERAYCYNEDGPEHAGPHVDIDGNEWLEGTQ